MGFANRMHFDKYKLIKFEVCKYKSISFADHYKDYYLAY